MVNLKAAIEIATAYNPGMFVDSAHDFGEFYVFEMKNLNDKNKGTQHTGRMFPAVNKKTDKYFLYDITSDIDLFENSQEIF